MSERCGRYSIFGNNLTLLQDIVRRDPQSYKDEFNQQLENFEDQLRLIKLQPNFDENSINAESMGELVGFLTATSPCYKDAAKQFTNILINILSSKSSELPPHMRLSFVKALMTMRNRGFADSLQILDLAFELIKCEDKELRKLIFTLLVRSIAGKQDNNQKKKFRQLAIKKTDPKTLSHMHNAVIRRLKDNRSIVCLTALLLLIRVYRKRQWANEKSANAIANCCFHKIPKLQIAAMKFFLGNQSTEGGTDSDNSDIEEETRTVKEVMVGYKAGKKTNKRKKHMEREKEKIQKQLSKKKSKKSDRDCNLIAMQQLHDAQSFTERLHSKLDGAKSERFEVRMLRMALIAQLIGVHELVVLPFYTYMQRYLTPQQRDVTKLLLYVAQASHHLVPPDSMKGVIRCIADNFVSDRCSSEAITVGLNACTHILQRCPYAIDQDLLQDLTAYKKYLNTNVRMAARSLINLYRNEHPELLHRKDRTKPTEASKEHQPTQYGHSNTLSFITGAEALRTKEKEYEEINERNQGEPSDKDDFIDDDSVDDEDDGMNDENDAESLNDENDINEDVDNVEEDTNDEPIKQSIPEYSTETSNQLAAMYSTNRVFDDDDFKRIRKHQLKKQLQGCKRKAPMSKRQIKMAKKTNAQAEQEESNNASDDSEQDETSVDSDDDDEDDANIHSATGLPTLAAIEHLHKKARRATKEERLATVLEGREGREKFGRPKKKGSHVGRTNKNLAKKKNFMMVRHKLRGKNRQRSYQERQRALSNFINKAQKGRKRR